MCMIVCKYVLTLLFQSYSELKEHLFWTLSVRSLLILSKTALAEPESQASVAASLTRAGNGLGAAAPCRTGGARGPQETSRRPSGREDGRSGSFPDVGNPAEMQALRRQPLLLRLLLQVQSPPVSEQRQELLLDLP